MQKKIQQKIKERSGLPEIVRGGFSASENKLYQASVDDDSKPISPLQSYSSKGFRIKPRTEQSQQRLQHSSKEREAQEKQKIIEKLRDKYLPLDFESIKEHERTFLANAYIKKAQREQELKQKLKQQESSYKLPQVSGATKTYQAAKEEYLERRANGAAVANKKQLESVESRERMKKYTEKLRTMSLLDERAQLSKLAGSVNGQPPTNASNKGESVYGRFGREWEKKLNQDASEKKYLEEMREKGLEYLQVAKSKAAKKEFFSGASAIDERPPEPQEPTPHEQAKQQRDKGNEYLKFARSMAAKGKAQPSPADGSRAAVLSRVERTEAEVLSMERKVKMGAGGKDGREVEDAYLNSIKAKLQLLDAV